VIQLGVNIDHVATIRQARRGDEPDPVRAAHEAELGGADGITVHLREDRRHIQDRDIELLRSLVKVKFNLEMAATPEMVELACRIRPHTAMLVPEGRQEVTTEGGLDVFGQVAALRGTVSRLRDAGVFVSAFIDADARQVEAAAKAGFNVSRRSRRPAATFSGWACGSTPGTRSTTTTSTASPPCRGSASSISATPLSAARSTPGCARRCGR
jgi:pyridoxine 5-phosphate synthase